MTWHPPVPPPFNPRREWLGTFEPGTAPPGEIREGTDVIDTAWRKLSLVNLAVREHMLGSYSFSAHCNMCGKDVKTHPYKTSFCGGCGRLFKMEFNTYCTDIPFVSDDAPEHPTVRLDERART